MMERFPVSDGVVEMGVVRMRMAVGRTGGKSYRPRICFWVDQRSGMILHFEMTEPLQSYLPLVTHSLNDLAKRMGGLPRQIQLRDVRLANDLRHIVQPAGIEVVARESLPMLDQAVANMMEFKELSGEPEPGLLDVPGMTLDHVIAFAEAARAFYIARPWQHLIDDDLIWIESPAGPHGAQFAQVLGAGGETFGLGFVASRKAHEGLRDGNLPRGGIWSLQFSDIDGIPFDDGEAWQRHGFPVAGPDAYPCFICTWRSKAPEYPTPDQLVWAEGLLRALAATTEDELDQAKWEKSVNTHAGAPTYKFSLPILLEQMSHNDAADRAHSTPSPLVMESTLRAIHQQLADRADKTEEGLNQFLQSMRGKRHEFVPTTDAERAQALCYQAYESRGRRQVQLVRQALAIDADCCDALAFFANRENSPERARPLFERAVEAGRRQLGEERFEIDAGHFWGIIETRPYMRARRQLAQTLMDLGEFDGAAIHLDDLLRLNPGDTQGNRYDLAQCLLSTNRLDELDTLLNRSQYKEDFAAEWVFTRLLLEYRRNGDSAAARKCVNDGRKCNLFVAPLLTGQMPMPRMAPSSYSPGSEEEAVVCVEQIADGWHETDGAIEWLRAADSQLRNRIRQYERQRERKRKRR